MLRLKTPGCPALPWKAPGHCQEAPLLTTHFGELCRVIPRPLRACAACQLAGSAKTVTSVVTSSQDNGKGSAAGQTSHVVIQWPARPLIVMPSSARSKKNKRKGLQDAARSCQSLTSLFKRLKEDQSADCRTPIATSANDIPQMEISNESSNPIRDVPNPNSECDRPGSVPSQDQTLASTSSADTSVKETGGKHDSTTFKASHSKHKVGYQKSWEKDRHWLKSEIASDPDGVTKPGMFCTICRTLNMQGSNGSTVWAAMPCTSLRRDRVIEHQKSNMHLQAVKLEIGQCLLTEEEVFPSATLLAIEGAMKSVKFFIDHDIPMTTIFKPFIEFCINDLHSPILTPLDVAGNAKYTSASIQDDLVSSLSTVCKELLLNTLSASPAAALLIDEATDVSTRKHLALVVKYLDKYGDVKTQFLEDIEVPKGTSEMIVQTIVTVCSNLGLPLSSFQAIGTDGASAMVGCKSGVVTRLKAIIPTLISIHCMNHRLALGSKDSFEGVRFLDELDETMQATYTYYKQSTNRTAALKTAQELLKGMGKEGSDCVTLKKASFARWLSHELQASSLRRSYLAVLTDLENTIAMKEKSSDKGPTADGLLKKLANYKTYYGLCRLNDVLVELASLSLFLQSDNLIISELETKLTFFYLTLKKLEKRPGVFARKASKNAQAMGIVPREEDQIQVDQVFRSWIPKLSEEIKERFQQQEIISALGALDLSRLDKVGQRGLEAIETLSDHFGIDEEELSCEWEQLNDILQDVIPDANLLYMHKFILKTQERLNDCTFKHLKFLTGLALVLPLSTACVERIFAQVKNIVTDQRNRLGIKKVNNYLLIKFTSIDSIDFSNAAKIFLSQKRRRIVSIDSTVGHKNV